MTENNDEIEVQILNVSRYKSLAAEDFAAWTAQLLSNCEVSDRRVSFTLNARKKSGEWPDLIVTPLGEGKALLYTAEQQSFISAGIRVKREFEKTGEVGPGTRENFLLEVMKDYMRTFSNGVTPGTPQHANITSQVIEQVLMQMDSPEILLSMQPALNVTYTPPKPPKAG